MILHQVVKQILGDGGMMVLGCEVIMRGLQPKTVVQTIWRGVKDRVDHRVRLVPNGVGTCLTTIRDVLFFPINSDPKSAHLLKIDLFTQKSLIIYQTNGSITGITHWGTQKLLLIVSQGLSDYLVTISPEGRLLQQVGIGERKKGHPAIRIYAAPPRWIRMLDEQTLLVYSYGRNGFLYAFSLHGQLKRKWQGVTGVAFDPEKKRLYASGAVRGAGLLLIKPPREMKSHAWRLVGVDRNTNFYWYRSAASRSWLACADTRRIRWIVPLSDDGGVLRRLGRSLNFSLGWAGGMLEVFPDGRVWLSATQVDAGEAPVLVPGVYELRVLDK